MVHRLDIIEVRHGLLSHREENLLGRLIMTGELMGAAVSEVPRAW